MNQKQFLLVALFFVLGLSFGFSQNNVNTVLKKNINPLASTLTEELSVSRDSLLLENELLFSKIRFFNVDKDFDHTFYFKPAVKKAKIALNDLPLGSYSVMFYQIDRIIVFRLDRLSKFNNTIQSVHTGDDPALVGDINYIPKGPAPKRADEKTLDPNQSADFAAMSIDASDFALNTDTQDRSQTGLSTSNTGFLLSNADEVANSSNLNYKIPETGTYDLASTSSSSVIIPLETRLSTGSNGEQNGKTFDGNTIFSESDRKEMRPYDLSNQDRDYVETREHYRSTHLRPNGKPYD